MNPKITIKDVSPIQKELTVSIGVEEVTQEFDNTYKKMAQKANLKGFRPGKVPRSVLEQHYRSDAESEVLQHLVNQSYAEALHQVGVVPIAPPQIKVTGFGPLQELTYEATLEIPPKVEVKGHQGLKLKKDKIEVTDKEIEEQLKSLQERMTQLIPLTSDRPAQNGDVVAIDYQGLRNGKPIDGFHGENFLVELGKGHLFIELESALQGMRPGEKKQAVVTLPDNWTDKELAGQQVNYDLTLKEIKEKKVPELNDDFAKDLGAFTTLDEVKKKMSEDLARSKEQSAKNKLRRDILEILIKENEFLVPDGMIQMELEDMLHRVEGNLKQQGITMEQAGVTQEEFFQKNRDEAIFRVRGALLFDAVARQENIVVTPEEVDQKIEEMAKNQGQAPAAWKKYFQEQNLLGRVEAGILEEKALDFVLAHSTIK